LKNDIYFWYNDGQSNYIGKTSRTSTSYSWSIPSNLQGSITISVVSGREENNKVYTDVRDEITIKVTCGDKAPTQAPRLISPCGDAEVTNKVKLSWNSVSGATKYSIAVKRSSDGVFVVDEVVVTSTYYTIPFDLSSGWYTWNVRAGNNTGWGPWTTPACRFYVKSSSGGGCGTPTLISPSSGATLSSSPYNFSWSSVSGAVYYHINFYDASKNDLGGNADLKYTTVRYNELSTKIKYWRVRAYCSSGWGSWSEYRAVNIGSSGGGSQSPTSPPSLISPSNGSTVNPGRVTFQWSSVSKATYYQFELYNGNSRVLNGDNRSTSCSVELGKNRESLKWRVRACNSYGCGPWSSFSYFTNRGG